MLFLFKLFCVSFWCSSAFLLPTVYSCNYLRIVRDGDLNYLSLSQEGARGRQLILIPENSIFFLDRDQTLSDACCIKIPADNSSKTVSFDVSTPKIVGNGILNLVDFLKSQKITTFLITLGFFGPFEHSGLMAAFPDLFFQHSDEVERALNNLIYRNVSYPFCGDGHPDISGGHFYKDGCIYTSRSERILSGKRSMEKGSFILSVVDFLIEHNLCKPNPTVFFIDDADVGCAFADDFFSPRELSFAPVIVHLKYKKNFACEDSVFSVQSRQHLFKAILDENASCFSSLQFKAEFHHKKFEFDNQSHHVENISEFYTSDPYYPSDRNCFVGCNYARIRCSDDNASSWFFIHKEEALLKQEIEQCFHDLSSELIEQQVENVLAEIADQESIANEHLQCIHYMNQRMCKLCSIAREIAGLPADDLI